MKTLTLLLALAIAAPAVAQPTQDHWSRGFGDPVAAMRSPQAAQHYAERNNLSRLDAILSSIGKAMRKGSVGYYRFNEKGTRIRVLHGDTWYRFRKGTESTPGGTLETWAKENPGAAKAVQDAINNR